MNNIEQTIPKFGEIYYANLKSEGHIQGGYRPVLIVQNNTGNKHSPTLNIFPISSQIDKAKHLPMHVFISSETTGLSKDSVVLVEQMRTIDKDNLRGNKISSLDENSLKRVGAALRMQLPFPV